MIAVGEQAPDFTLRNQDGEKVSLSDYRGRKVMLVFYPGDFSPVCGDQLSIYQEVKPEIEEKGVELIGISVDGFGELPGAGDERHGVDELLCDQREGEDHHGQDAATEIGTTTRRKAPNRLQPSIIAASSRSPGIALKNPMRSQVQKGIVNDG